MIEKLGKYNIIGELGQGAMGTVYKGEDPLIGRVVAIKTIKRSGLSEQGAEEAAARFKQEAQAAGRLSHPNIVVVYDYGEEGDIAFIAMAFVEGRELKSYFDNNEVFALEDIVRIMEQLLDALHFAHKNKIVHRDIKPGNIMVNDNGHIMITDFGIARLETSELTQVGAAMGTPSYMSPEQCMGQRIDGRADIFSAAVILYQLLTNEKPFPGNNITAIMHKILKVEPVLPSELNPQIPKAFDEIIARGLAKSPNDRYATAHDFLADIKAAFNGEALQAAWSHQSAKSPQPTESTQPAKSPQPTKSPQQTKSPEPSDSLNLAEVSSLELEFKTTRGEPVPGSKAAQFDEQPTRQAADQTISSTAMIRDYESANSAKSRRFGIAAGFAGVALIAAAGALWFMLDKTRDDAEPGEITQVKNVGSVMINTIPQSAKVFVDGKMAADVTPLSLELANGEHELKFSLEGHYEVPMIIDIAGGQDVPLSVTLFKK
jgi:serine/threonine protein kinase